MNINIEYVFNEYADIVYYILAHIKVDNASDVYDEDYIDKMRSIIGESPWITDEFQAYYNDNFERLQMINFVPLFAGNMDELLYAVKNLPNASEEDKKGFLTDFGSIIEKYSTKFFNYWREYCDLVMSQITEVKDYFRDEIDCLNDFFQKILTEHNKGLKIVFSHSLTVNGRAMFTEDNIIIMLPFPDEKRSMKDVFLQLVHECTHSFTDPLLANIRMDDGTHDVAEYQVVLYDLWLLENSDERLSDYYRKWITEDYISESLEHLGQEQIEALKMLLPVKESAMC